MYFTLIISGAYLGLNLVKSIKVYADFWLIWSKYGAQLGSKTEKRQQIRSMILLTIVQTKSVFPISAKKCNKCEIFSGIFALKFCEFRRFFSRQKPAFLFPAKNRRQLQFTAPRSGMSQKSRRKVAELRRRTYFFFFFLENNIKSEKKMPPSAWWPFFFFLRSHWNRTKMMRKFSAFSRLHYFQHFRRRWKLRGNTEQN